LGKAAVVLALRAGRGLAALSPKTARFFRSLGEGANEAATWPSAQSKAGSRRRSARPNALPDSDCGRFPCREAPIEIAAAEVDVREAQERRQQQWRVVARGVVVGGIGLFAGFQV
jgi:hypothetical protein